MPTDRERTPREHRGGLVIPARPPTSVCAIPCAFLRLPPHPEDLTKTCASPRTFRKRATSRATSLRKVGRGRYDGNTDGPRATANQCSDNGLPTNTPRDLRTRALPDDLPRKVGRAQYGWRRGSRQSGHTACLTVGRSLQVGGFPEGAGGRAAFPEGWREIEPCGGASTWVPGFGPRGCGGTRRLRSDRRDAARIRTSYGPTSCGAPGCRATRTAAPALAGRSVLLFLRRKNTTRVNAAAAGGSPPARDEAYPTSSRPARARCVALAARSRATRRGGRARRPCMPGCCATSRSAVCRRLPRRASIGSPSRCERDGGLVKRRCAG